MYFAGEMKPVQWTHLKLVKTLWHGMTLPRLNCFIVLDWAMEQRGTESEPVM